MAAPPPRPLNVAARFSAEWLRRVCLVVVIDACVGHRWAAQQKGCTATIANGLVYVGGGRPKLKLPNRLRSPLAHSAISCAASPPAAASPLASN